MRLDKCFVVLSTMAALVSLPAAGPQPTTRLTAGAGGFMLDGKPYQILSGEMHYPRVPREYWRDRFRKARAMGLNTISTYVFWNLHEPAPGRFDFTGQNDVAAFVRQAIEEKLNVIIRPGPYVCAEWDLGGYPAWLLADESLVLRSTDPRFTTPAARWLDRLGRELAPILNEAKRTTGHGVIAVQVENEYGSFDKDKAYLEWQRDALLHAGFGSALLYTADGPPQLTDGTLPGVPAVVNFGTGGAENAFKRLAVFRPDGPPMTGEYWAGWFDHWGRAHARTNMATQVRELTWMLGRGYSINFYMFHGGTTFGFMNGANIDNGRYYPQTSSYDYDAALSESGRLTPKYFAFREAIAAHVKAALDPIPASSAPIAIESFDLERAAALWDALPAGIRSDRPKPMENFGQSYGYILYRTRVSSPFTGELIARDVRDYALVFVDRKLAGTIDRRLNQDRVSVVIPASGAEIDILVENLGRVNFTKVLREERKGVTKSVSLADRELTGWTVYPLPMSSVPRPRLRSSRPDGPAFYAGAFQLSTTGDTFLDTRGWGKGTVWVNGHHLGRFWDIGPQQTLYVPGAWLRAGSNEVVVFALDKPAQRTMAGLPGPIFSN